MRCVLRMLIAAIADYSAHATLMIVLVLPTAFFTVWADEAAASPQAYPPASPERHQKVAAEYFEARLSGNVEQAKKLVGGTFYLDPAAGVDGKKLLRTREEVASAHDKIMRKKGARKVPKYTISETDKAPTLNPSISINVYTYRVMVGDKHIDIYVLQSKYPKVICFKD